MATRSILRAAGVVLTRLAMLLFVFTLSVSDSQTVCASEKSNGTLVVSSQAQST